MFFRVLIGAPEAQTDQPNVDKGGAVYKCRSKDGHCEITIFDARGKNRRFSHARSAHDDDYIIIIIYVCRLYVLHNKYYYCIVWKPV